MLLVILEAVLMMELDDRGWRGDEAAGEEVEVGRSR
jgi:hypothetical protein